MKKETIDRATGQTRREFIKSATAAGTAAALPAFIPSTVLGANAPSNRTTLGCIGVGRMGSGDMRSFMGFDEVQVVAVCDVDANRARNALGLVERKYGKGKKDGSYKGCKTYGDFREAHVARNRRGQSRKGHFCPEAAEPDH